MTGFLIATCARQVQPTDSAAKVSGVFQSFGVKLAPAIRDQRLA